ncbi:MAG: hypothetical protein ACHQ1G_00245, partial [Planctomycetota bacterium]
MAVAVQPFEFGIAASSSSNTQAISEVTPGNTAVFWSMRCDGTAGATPTDSKVRMRLTSATQLTLDRAGTAGAITARAAVVSGVTGLTNEHLAGSMTGAAQQDIAVSPVADVTEAFPLWSRTEGGGGSTYGDDDWDTVFYLDEDTVRRDTTFFTGSG